MSKHTKESLKEQGYAGLCNPAEQCGCGLDDLRPCCLLPEDDRCEPAYYWECLRCVDQLRCEYAFADNTHNTHGCYKTTPQVSHLRRYKLP